MDGKIEKSHGGVPPGPRGGAEAGVRREAPNGGRSGAPRARRRTPVWIFNFTIHREKVKILRKKVRDTQPNPSYSAKNNVAIRVIATFMPNTTLRHCYVSNVISNWFISQKSLCLSVVFIAYLQLILTCFYMCRVIYYFTDFREFPQHWFLWNHTSTATFFHIIFPSHFQKWWKFTILRPYDFHRCPIFFWHPTQCMLVFTVLANFLHQILPRKKPSLYEKISCFF